MGYRCQASMLSRTCTEPPKKLWAFTGSRCCQSDHTLSTIYHRAQSFLCANSINLGKGENLQHDAKRTADLKDNNVTMRGGSLREPYTPFGAHVGSGIVQFDGAFRGQDPPRSLEAAQCEKCRSLCDPEVAHPPTISCTALCAP